MEKKTELIPERYLVSIIHTVSFYLCFRRNIITVKILKQIYGKSTSPEIKECLKEARQQWNYYVSFRHGLHYKYGTLLDKYVAYFISHNKVPLQRELVNIEVPK